MSVGAAQQKKIWRMSWGGGLPPANSKRENKCGWLKYASNLQKGEWFDWIKLVEVTRQSGRPSIFPEIQMVTPARPTH
jgi:hypothetical protein